MEIERKFLIKKNAFELDKYNYIDIQQAYISTSPVIRLRKREEYSIQSQSYTAKEYILTVKSKGMLSRQEFELALSFEDYTKLLEKVEGNIITKRRYLIPLDKEHTLELDYFMNMFEGLVMGEIEFDSEDDANKYNLPNFILREVTFDKRFHNSNMSSMTEKQALDLIDFMH